VNATLGIRPVVIPTLLLASVFALSACHRNDVSTTSSPPAVAPNEVVLYLQGAERQAETDAQEAEILRALEDLQTLTPAELRVRRYADYALQPQQWSLGHLLQKYFVPPRVRSLDEDALYRDAQDPTARAVIEEQIQAIHEHRQVVPAT
jgi:hypothetical protein